MLTTKQMASIRTHLQNNYKLPNKGFVAGQSVASLIYKELKLDINTPINDVDVFSIIENDYNNFAKMKHHISNIGVMAVEGSKSNFVYCSGSRGYEVKLSTYSKEDNKVNLVYISQKHDKINVDKELLLNSFDFNCCSVGFDIETGEFIWTKGFEKFIKTKQLRVQSVHTPLHTLLRLNKKLIDLGENIYCDKEVERELLVSAMIYFSYQHEFRQVVGTRFFKLYYKYKDDFISSLIEKRLLLDDEIKKPTYRRIIISKEKTFDYIQKSKINHKNIFEDYSFDNLIAVKKLVKDH